MNAKQRITKTTNAHFMALHIWLLPLFITLFASPDHSQAELSGFSNPGTESTVKNGDGHFG